MFKYQDLQMLGLKLNKYEYFSATLGRGSEIQRHVRESSMCN